MSELYLKNRFQKDGYSSPWSKKQAILIRVWEVVWTFFVRWLPKPFYRWHVLLLKLFGCKVHGHVFIAPSCRIYAPWLLEIDKNSCLGPRSEVYNLGPVKIGKRTTLAQYTYICNGTHDFTNPISPLLVGNIEIGDDVFIGAKAIILPGLKINNGSVIGAGSVLVKNTEPWTVVGGNPARFIKRRELKE
ncbi:acyltransferase [Xylanibacter caecicola]|uniref:acyltransferase n=1 Tax=Xylanibacter caecicola TaxID=2736294 RepID=UPI00258F4324|nr:DapH/DapD/GlmU-related protein [Xylanibacter caecicola]